MTATHDYPPPPPPPPLALEDVLADVPIVRFYCPLDGSIYKSIQIISRREARRRDRRNAKARKHANPAWKRRHDRRQTVILLSLIALILAGLFAAPSDPFHKYKVPAPSPAQIVKPATVTTVTRP